MEMIIYLGLLFAALSFGMGAAAIGIIPPRMDKLVGKMLTVSLYGLLFSMGVKTGLIDDIGRKLSHIGVSAVAFAAAAAGGSLLFVIAAGYITAVIQKKKGITQNKVVTYNLKPEKKGTIGEIALHMKEPAILITIVAAGAVLAAATNLFSWFSDSVTEWLLYLLLFLVGVQMVHDRTDVSSIIHDPVALALPVLTVLGTLTGVSIIPIFSEIKLHEALAVGAGFGWYSLSGVLISDLGDPVLGSIAFLSNLFRESIAFILIPLLASYGKHRAAISVCGATSMDVTLPMVEKFCGVNYVPLALAHGIILTIIVPIIVPVLYASGV
jgi:uncharacterized membrane protein YbjE (DUF340 family)